MTRCEICGGFVGAPDHDENGDCSLKPYPNFPCSAEPIEKPKDVFLVSSCVHCRGRIEENAPGEWLHVSTAERECHHGIEGSPLARPVAPVDHLVQIGTALPMLDHSGVRWMFCAEGTEVGIPIFIKGGIPT